MLGALLGHVDLELSPILLVRFDERLVLIRDVVVIQKWALVKPVWKMRDRRLYYFERAVFSDVLAICAKD